MCMNVKIVRRVEPGDRIFAKTAQPNQTYKINMVEPGDSKLMQLKKVFYLPSLSYIVLLTT